MFEMWQSHKPNSDDTENIGQSFNLHILNIKGDDIMRKSKEKQS